jgi:hypothetical protein
LRAKAGRAIIIFSASWLGFTCYLAERFFAYDFSSENGGLYAIDDSGVFSAGTYLRTGGGIPGVVNDLL